MHRLHTPRKSGGACTTRASPVDDRQAGRVDNEKPLPTLRPQDGRWSCAPDPLGIPVATLENRKPEAKAPSRARLLHSRQRRQRVGQAAPCSPRFGGLGGTEPEGPPAFGRRAKPGRFALREVLVKSTLPIYMDTAWSAGIDKTLDRLRILTF